MGFRVCGLVGRHARFPARPRAPPSSSNLSAAEYKKSATVRPKQSEIDRLRVKREEVKGIEGLFPVRKATIWPWLSHMCHIRSTAGQD